LSRTLGDIPALTAIDLARRIRARELSAVEACDAFTARIEALNPRLNALVRFDPSLARAAARRADERLAAGDGAPLLGVPFTVKDNIWVKGQAVSQGSRLFADFVAPEDAFAVARMRAAGGVFLGITNCSEFACKGVTTNRLFGPTRNPWDSARTPGGSSGGAASAVAAGLCPIALATDGGGSTRRPAAHVGAVGMKPSAGVVPHPTGFAEPVFGNSVVGQITRSVADAVLALDAIAAPDLADPQGLPAAVWLRAEAEAPAPRNARIAYSPRLGLGFPVDRDVAGCVASAAKRLQAAGFAVEEADPDWPEGTAEEALMPLQLAGLAALYGERLTAGDWEADPDIAAQIEAGLGVSGASVAAALLLRDALYRSLAGFFRRFDFLLTPTTPVTAWPLDRLGPAEIEGKQVSPRGHAVFTPLFNHTYVPACSVPCGLDDKGLPVGIQVVGRRFADARVLALAAEIERQNPIDFSRPREPRTVSP
jgi:aspartyl-tRNA(Asn)/glutamyl-tRNA(Gln) amidotransferase subunit A